MAEVEMVAVRSSNVAAVGYDEPAQELYVEFNGGGLAYIYQGVPPELADEMFNAQSKGQFVWHNLRGVFPFRRG